MTQKSVALLSLLGYRLSIHGFPRADFSATMSRCLYLWKDNTRRASTKSGQEKKNFVKTARVTKNSYKYHAPFRKNTET